MESDETQQSSLGISINQHPKHPQNSFVVVVVVVGHSRKPAR